MTRALAALIVLVAYAVAAFGWRSLHQLRRHGDSGLRLARPERGAPRVAHGLLVVALALAVATPVAAVVAGDAAAPGGAGALVTGGLGTAAVVAGSVLLAAGFALTLAAQVQMGASWRVGVDPEEATDLVTGGLYRWLRNPIYTAMLLALAGLVLLVPSGIALAALVVGTVALQLQVRVVEEPHLLRHHGATYRRWAGEVGRFLPGVGRLRP